MGMRYSGLMRSAQIVLAVVLSTPWTADGRELIWRGKRDNLWHHGVDPKTGDSNWYSPGGRALRAPSGADLAVFPAAADRTIVNITRDGEELPPMRFDAPEPYSFNIRSFSTLIGDVTAGAFGSLPKVKILEGKTLVIRGNGGFVTDSLTLQMVVRSGGTLRLMENAGGLDGTIRNFGGVIDFDNDSVPGVTTIHNLTHAAPFQSLIRFYGNSRGVNAAFINREDALLDFSVGREDNSARSIVNHGRLQVGTRLVDVHQGFSQSSSGSLLLDVAQGKIGHLQIYGGGKLAGRLIITGAHTLSPATYTIMRMIGAPRTGRFSEVTTTAGRIAYGANRVVLIIDPPS